MSEIRKTAVVPYTAEQMYELVNDIESYPEFLPWCDEAGVWDRSETGLKAFITIASRHIRHSFTTENSMHPGRRIDVQLVKGPFKYLRGHWHFEPIDHEGCRIMLHMDFEFKNRLMKLALDQLFHHIVNSLVDAFTRRARQVYGSA